MKILRFKKAVAAGVGFVALALVQGLLHGTVEQAAEAVVATATIFGVYQAKNEV